MKEKHTFFPDLPRPFVFGHRGYNARALENTIASFDLCVEHNIKGVELDVHMCKRGEIVVIHDHNLTRLAQLDVCVEDLTWETLKEITLHREEETGKIPLLRDLFQRYGDSFYYDIELKVSTIRPTHIVEKTIALIKEFHLENKVMVSSFNPFILRYWNKVTHSTFPSGIIYSKNKQVPRALPNGDGRFIAAPSLLKPHHSQITSQLMRNLHQKHSYPIVAWTVNTKDECERLLDFDLEGFVSDDPLEIIRTIHA
jgi:glycerophosphoryl diester phosphodiesterase